MVVMLGILEVIGFVVGVGGLLRLKERIDALYWYRKFVGEVEGCEVWWEIR